MKYQEILIASPIRTILNKTEEETIFEINDIDKEIDEMGVRGLADDIQKTLKHIDESNQSAMRVAVIGELKAGKSTLINAIVGKEVAYTDVLEATAVVSEIFCGDEEQVTLHKKDGSSYEISDVSELNQMMQEYSYNKTASDELERVDIKVNQEVLKNIILVDTPGLLTITDRNEEATKSYLHQVDYILWVLNGNNLGDSNVNDAITKVAQYKKQMAMIVNKIDTEDMREEVEEYVNEIYEGLFQEFFFVSARNGWKARKQQDEDGLRTSGIAEFIEFLTHIGSYSVEDKSAHERESGVYQLKRELDLHKKLLASIKGRKQQFDGDINILNNIRDKSKQRIDAELKFWIDQDLFMKERGELLSCNDDAFEKMLSLYASAEYVEGLLQAKYKEIAEYVYQDWQGVHSQIFSDKIAEGEAYDKFSFCKVENNVEVESVQRESDVDKMQKAEKGAVFGAKIGLALAGYTAWLGPSAAYISIGSAMASCIPALAIGGYFISKHMTMRNAIARELGAVTRQKQIDNLQSEIIGYIKTNAVPKMRKMMYTCVSHYYDGQLEQISELVNKVGFDYSEPAYSSFTTNVNQYISDIENIIHQLENSSTPSFEEKQYI